MVKKYNRIREVLKDKGVRQTWLAERLGMTHRNLSYMITNQHQPSLEILYEISLLLDMDLTELLVPKTEIFDSADIDAALRGNYTRKQKRVS